MRITLIKIAMTTLSAVSVTGPEALLARGRERDSSDPSKELDMPIYRDASGAPTIPGTTIAGSLRAHLNPELREPLMGTTEPEAVSSPLHVSDAIVTGPSEVADTLVRQRTAIDRHRGAPASSKLFDIEAVAAGSTLSIYLELHSAADLADSLLSTLASWTPRLGRGVTTGSGAVRTDSIIHTSLNLDDESDLLTYLNFAGVDDINLLLRDAGAHVTPMPPEQRWLIDARFDIVDALHVGSGDAQRNLLLIEKDPHGRPVVPGTSLKGALRSRCEYILRSLGVEACLDGSCGVCPTCILFGCTYSEPDVTGRTGQRGLVAVHDAVVERSSLTERAHVAIDRVTGGALDSALYSMECLDHGEVSIRIEELQESPPWAKGLLHAALRDIGDGYVGLGGSTTRGYGTLRWANEPDNAESTATAALAELHMSFSEVVANAQ